MSTQMKGTFICQMGTGGFSESLYCCDAQSANVTYQDMMTRMGQLLPYRAALSLIGATPTINVKTLNGVSFTHIRVEDELRFKDSLINDAPSPGTGYVIGTVPSDLYRQNLYQDEAAKVQWNGNQAGQQVTQYLHGIPVAATDDNLSDQSATSELHFVNMNAQWLSALATYAHQIRARNLGFRNLNSPWDINGAPGPMAQPVAVVYNAVAEKYEIQMPQAPPQFKMRYVLRGFKALNFLNGRWPGVDIGANKIQIQRRARNVTWDNTGYVSPEVWNYFTPNETVPANPAFLPGAKFFFMTTKKIGRPFGLPRGRAKVRPT